MRIMIFWGEEEKLMNKVVPRSYWTSSKDIFRKRMDWIIKLMEKDSGRDIDELC